jgi:hypothetical protein
MPGGCAIAVLMGFFLEPGAGDSGGRREQGAGAMVLDQGAGGFAEFFLIHQTRSMIAESTAALMASPRRR